MASRAKKVKKTSGYASQPPRKKGKKLSEKTMKIVRDFYFSDDVSRIQPGLNDYKSVNQNGSRTQEQKRLLLFNIKELHIKFKNLNPDLQISLSSFRKLKPRECILPGKNGTHNVCVCKIHQNMKMKIFGMKQQLKKVKTDFTETYHGLIKSSVCLNPTPKCYFLTCEKCPGYESVIDDLFNLLKKNNVGQITYSEWISTDRYFI